MGDLTEHFSRSELECRCGCGLFNAKGRLLSTLEAIRRAVGKSVHIESGCRCAEKNADVGGKPDSGHLTGEAADIWVEGLSNRDLGVVIKDLHRRKLLPYLRYCYLIRGRTNTRVHVGVDEKPRRGVFGF